MTNTPCVSICVQTYNHEEYISECLESLISQKTNFDYEIVLGEDDSDDKTREICLKYANRFPHKIKLFLRSRKDVIYINGYPTGRFNMIENLKSSRGKYIAICEGDDYWSDEFKLQKQVDYLEQNLDYSGCTCLTECYDVKMSRHYLYRNYNKDAFGYKDILKPKVPFHTSSFVFRRLCIMDGLPSWIYKVVVGDHPLFFHVSLYGRIKSMNFVGSVYRLHIGGLSKGNLHLNQLYNANRIITWRAVLEDLGHFKKRNDAISYHLKLLIFKHKIYSLFEPLYSFLPTGFKKRIIDVITR